VLRGGFSSTQWISGIHADALKIALLAPPVDGKANEALIAFLADALHLLLARVALVAGTTSRANTVHTFTGKRAAEVQPRSCRLRLVEICRLAI
jgi:uncharacterized protein YggU (UPF0235/DUF167 family)